MINGLEGIPGSGKSYEAVVFHVLEALKKGRRVITNLPLNIQTFAALDPAYVDLIERRTRPMPVRGTWNPDRVDEDGNGLAYVMFAEGEEPQDAPKRSETIFAGVWDYYTDWKHPTTGQGPLIVIDECHNPLSREDTDPQVVEWYKLHRHFNVDVLLMTQSFRDMNQPIARLVAMLVKVRKADILGKKDCYIRKVHAGYRGAVISQDERKYLPQMFPLYKSHTQGNSVGEAGASDVAPFLVKFNRFKWAFIAVTLLYAVYAFWPAPPKPKVVAGMQRIPLGATYPASAASAPRMATSAPLPQNTADTAPAVVVAAQDYPEPYESKGLHMTGRMSMAGKTIYTFLVSQNGQPIGGVVDAELKQAGYHWKPLTDCAGVLTFNGKQRAVTCDAPQGAMGIPFVSQVGNTPAAMPKAVVPAAPQAGPHPFEAVLTKPKDFMAMAPAKTASAAL